MWSPFSFAMRHQWSVSRVPVCFRWGIIILCGLWHFGGSHLSPFTVAVAWTREKRMTNRHQTKQFKLCIIPRSCCSCCFFDAIGSTLIAAAPNVLPTLPLSDHIPTWTLELQSAWTCRGKNQLYPGKVELYLLFRVMQHFRKPWQRPP